MPNKKNSYGLFEFNQAKLLSQRLDGVCYAYVDNQSIRINRSIHSRNFVQEGVRCYGKSLPIGGLPKPSIEKIRSHELISLLNEVTIDGHQPDVIYAHFPLLTLTPRFVQELTTRGIRLVCMEHWSKVRKTELSQREASFLKHLVANSNAFCCVSVDLERSIRRITNDNAPIYVIPNMVSSEVFSPIHSKKETPRESDAFTFIALGRLVRDKKFDLVLDAFSRLSNKRTNLTIAGDGPDGKRLKRKTRALGVDRRVTFVGWLNSDEVASLLKVSDCYVSASDDETFGVPFVEAWMCGIPCIGPSNNPLRDSFNETRGMLFERNDIESLAEAMDAVSSDHRLNRASAISPWAKSCFSEIVVIDRVIEVIKTALQDKDSSTRMGQDAD